MKANILIILCILVSSLQAQESENIEQLGRIYNQWWNVNSIQVQESYAYLASSLAGLQILDISDLQNPVCMGYLDSVFRDASDIFIEGNYAFMLSLIHI